VIGPIQSVRPRTYEHSSKFTTYATTMSKTILLVMQESPMKFQHECLWWHGVVHWKTPPSLKLALQTKKKGWNLKLILCSSFTLIQLANFIRDPARWLMPICLGPKPSNPVDVIFICLANFIEQAKEEDRPAFKVFAPLWIQWLKIYLWQMTKLRNFQKHWATGFTVFLN